MVGGIAVLFYSAAPVVVPILLLFSSGYRVFSRAGARRFFGGDGASRRGDGRGGREEWVAVRPVVDGQYGGQNMVKSVIIAG